MPIDNLPLAKGTTPSHIESAQGDVFVLGSTLLQDNPQLLSTYYKQSGYPVTTLSKLKIFGMGTPVRKGVEGPITGHYESPRPKDIFTVGEIIGTDGNEITISLSEDDMVVQTNEVGTTIFSRPRVTEVYQFQIAGNKYRVIEKDRTVNPHQIVLQGPDGADPEDDIVEGAIASYISTLSGEGTAQPEPLRPRRYKYQNTFWIAKETDITSGTHLTTAAPFQVVPGSNLIYKEGLKDAEMRMEQAKGHVWMFGEQVAGWTDYSDPLKSEVPIPGTQGLLDFALENGLDMEYDTADFTEDDVYALSAYFHDIRVGASEILLMEGYNVNVKFERFFSDKYNYNWVIGLSDRYVAEGVRNARAYDSGFTEQGMFVNLGITGFAMGNYTYLQTSAPELDYMGGAGAIGGKDWAVATPFGFAGEAADNRPYVGYEWRGTPGYSRENEMWVNGGAGNDRVVTKSSEFDVQNTYMRSEIAPHFSLGEFMAVLHPAGTSAS